MIKRITLLFLFFMSIGFAQEPQVKADLSSPYNTINTHLYFLQPNSYQPDKAALTIYGFTGEQAEKKAIRLKKILDGRGLRVNMSAVPQDSNYVDSTSVGKRHIYVLFPTKMPQIYLEQIQGKWYYSSETIAQINKLYNQVYPWGTTFIKSLIPNSLHKTYLRLELWQYIGIVIIGLLSLLLFFIFRIIIFKILKRVENIVIRDRSDAVNQAIKQLSRPLTLILVFTFIEKTFTILELPLGFNTFIFLGLNIVNTVFWIYVFLKLVSVIMQIYADVASRTDRKLDDQLVPILNKLLQGLVLVVGLFNVLKLFGINTTTLIAGMSIGGLAVALASQDTVKNFIGTFMIFLDQPFQIGDWIEAGTVVGTVEEVGVRSTRVRAADTSIFQIPNSVLAEMTVNNLGLRLFRRYNTKLGLRYDTPPELIEEFVYGVREIIKAHPDTRSDAYNVEFIGFGDSALQIMMNTYFTDLGWNEEQSSRHRLHIAIVKLAKAIGVDFAFPSTTVIIEQFPEKKGHDMNYKIDQEHFKTALENIINDLKKTNT